MKNHDIKYPTNQEFDHFEVPGGMWDNIEKSLNEKRRKRRGIIWWSSSVAAILVIILISNGFFIEQEIKSKNKEVITMNETGAPENVVAQINDSFQRVVSNQSSDTDSNQEMLSEQVGIDGTSYSITVMDANGCATTTSPVLLQQNITLNFTSSSTINGGTAPYTYSWTAPNGQGYRSNLSATSNGTYAGPVNVPTSGVIDGVYIQEHIPTKRMIPYEFLNESKDEWSQEGLGGKLSLSADSITMWMENDPVTRSTYDEIYENQFLGTNKEPVSTFSIDVDGASYSDVRGMINRGELPHPNAVRIEEFINYFPYQYDAPKNEHPFSIGLQTAECPWNKKHKLMKIGIKGTEINKAQLPTNNLVFLLDVSGSMDSPEKLDLLKKGFRMLVNELRPEDRVAITVYAGAAGLVLPPTPGSEKDKIMDALNRLTAGGSTAGGAGIELAYSTAEKYFDKDGNNRVILATDGDFNVGLSDDNALIKLIEEKRKSGVYLTVLGFGHDNFQSSKMEKLANNGNGNFSFIDNILEAKKVLVTEMGATLKTIAKDVKIQVEFNPKHVKGYRLIGYENRLLRNEDFSNDAIDAGELGAGHTVTALYEIIPSNSEEDISDALIEPLKYTQTKTSSNIEYSDEMATVKFRYKKPDGNTSILIEKTIGTDISLPNKDFQFVEAVVEFGLILRNSQFKGTASFDSVLKKARNSIDKDPYGYRHEFIMLVEQAKLLMEQRNLE